MIPKTIHYCWFGRGEKNEVITRCIATWKKLLPEYEITEWNEDNYPIIPEKQFAFRMYQQKKWAFVADYARFDILAKHGGIYLDTDMYLLKPLDDLLHHACFLGKEDDEHISAGIIGAMPGNAYITKCKAFYDEHPDIVMTVPRLLTKIFAENFTGDTTIAMYEKNVFYPFSAETIAKFDPHDPPAGAYAIHMWNYSWGHPLNKFFKKMGIHRAGTKIAETLGVKKFLKKIFGFE